MKAFGFNYKQSLFLNCDNSNLIEIVRKTREILTCPVSQFSIVQWFLDLHVNQKVQDWISGQVNYLPN